MSDTEDYEIWADGQLRERVERLESADARAEIMSGMEPEVAFAVRGTPLDADGRPTGPEGVLSEYAAGQALPADGKLDLGI